MRLRFDFYSTAVRRSFNVESYSGNQRIKQWLDLRPPRDFGATFTRRTAVEYSSCVAVVTSALPVGVYDVTTSTNAVSRMFHLGARRKGRTPRAGVWFLGEGSNPVPPARGSGERCKLTQRGSGQSPDRPKVFHYFQHSGGPLLTL